MINKLFLLDSRYKNTISRDLQIGFFAERADKMPPTNFHVKNYLKGPEGLKKCRARFNSEIKEGRMIGGWGVVARNRKRVFGKVFLHNPLWGGTRYLKIKTLLGESYMIIVVHPRKKIR